MTEVARPLCRQMYRACLLIAFSAAALTVGCSKKPHVTTPPPASAPPPARPTVTLTADPTSINKGESATLRWS